MTVGLHHIARSGPDLDAAEAFTTEHLGFGEVAIGGGDGDRPDDERDTALDGTGAESAMLHPSTWSSS